MNREIAGDVRFFLATVLLGIAAALLYDFLRVWRRFRKQTLFVVSLQDFLYWFVLGLAGFSLIYRYNAGTLRFFAFLGISLGACLYEVTLGRFFVTYCLKLLRLLTFPIRKGLLFLRKQGKLVISRTRSRVRKKKYHGRMDALATEKRKKKNRISASFDSGTRDVRRVDVQHRQGKSRRTGKESTKIGDGEDAGFGRRASE